MKLLFAKPHIRFLLLLLLVIALVLVGTVVPVDNDAIDDFLKGIPLAYSSVAFAFLYVAGTFVVWYLKDPLKVVGAIIFGAYLSTLLIYIAEIINACIFFQITNSLGKDYVEKTLRGRFKRFYERIDEINLGWIFLLRAVPLIPYRVLDISFGLSKLPLKKYILVVILASLPRIFWVQFVLAGMKGFSMNAAVAYFNENNVVFFLSLAYFVITLIVAFRIKRKFQ
ncbi:MAG: VTT domain-containing protein [Deltaproteobacteria bacterium]|nr:VTT domain-containing protein [Deltaproteobacteria bacterium]